MNRLLWILTVTLLVVSPLESRGSDSSSPGPEFTEVWYLEVVSGAYEEAAQLYEGLYRQAALSRLSADDRERSAYRAGRCYEALGNERLARIAYEWLEKNGRAASTVRRRALARLRQLPSAEENATDASEDALGKTPRQIALEEAISASMVQVSEILQAIEEDVRRWPQARRRLQATVIELQLRSQANAELLDRLRGLGLELDFEISSRGFPLDVADLQAEFTRRVGSLVPWTIVKEHASRRFLEEGLRLAMARDFGPARGHLNVALTLDATLEGASEFLARLDELKSSDTLATLARSRLEEQQRLAVARLRQGLRTRLNRAARESALQRQDRVLPELRAAWLRQERAPRYALEDREVRLLCERLQHEFVLGGGEAAQRFLGLAWRDAAEEARRFLDLVFAWIELSHRTALRSRPPVYGSVISVRKIVAPEMERLSRELKMAGESDAARLSPEKVMAQQQLQSLHRWFPDVVFQRP